ncbi:uncharacterized protein Ecym_3475 [Eremothecium cymbalariae DBVPG|uniref:Protein Asterix n=1 Tax=Eremothecium cymbalariae (strain CBS 270.75 / DBVPG 7215 / KCTC 17166 / NRRL Y-17582) TaxID=931890 RepID=G8JS39_ERECY|nr:Hypothetical protein Ecym_3475 [Eremothecium cymbalariae DBVPG\
MTLHNVKRQDLAVGYYKHIPAPDTTYSSSQGLLSQSMPMLALFLRNKFLAWFSVVTAWHSFLTSDPNASSSATSSGDLGPVMKIVMGLMSVVVCYMGLVFPQTVPASPAMKTD